MKPLGSPPYICLITEGNVNHENYESEKRKIVRTARDAVSDGVNLIQIREKTLPARLLLELTRDVVSALAGSPALVLVNDRADIAVAAGADGVHLPELSLPAQVVREMLPPELVIGVSTHSCSAAKSAAASNADYILFGPIFRSPGKGEPVGVTGLQAVCDRLEGFPVIALGGITETNLEQCLASGAAGIAAIRSLHDAETRRAVCRSINAGYVARPLE